MLALLTVASVVMGSYGVKAFTAARDGAPVNLPVRLKHGTLYMTQETTNAAARAEMDGQGRGLYVVQFTGPVKEAYKSALNRLGVELGDYLPENAFLVRMKTALVGQVEGLGFVKGVARYTATMKLDRDLGRLGAGQSVMVRISTFAMGTKGPVGALSVLGLKPASIGMGTLTAEVDGDRLQKLAASTDVVFVEPLRQNQLFNDKAGAVMGVTNAWGAGLDGKGQVVAITDTGLDTGKNDGSLHPDFQGQVKSIYALGKPGDASDTLAHGTHVAGSVLGTGAASKGLYKGTAPGAKLVFQGVEDTTGGLGGIPADLGQLFRQAYGAGARIHTNSWGVPAASGGTVYDAQSAAVDRFMWENPEYTILFAAGNDGDHDRDGRTNFGTVSTPGTAKNAITVGAAQNDRPDKKMGTNIKEMASFSSRGPTGDNRVKPDVVAPGTWIVSARSSKAQDEHFWAPHESNSKYGYMGGTSMATPLTAGATAVARQYFVDKLGVTPRASLLKAALINGAAAMETGLTWKDTGWGRVDLNQSLYGSPFKFVNEEKALQTGDGQTYKYTVKKGQPLKVTLVWTDFPANPAAEKTLVNDLDLSVKGPDGAELLGNHMLARGADRTNNVENVVIGAPQDGAYTVSVKAHNVPQGPQRYALVVSGSVDGGASEPAPPPQDPQPNPPAEDRQAPTVSVSSPAEGASVAGTVQIISEAADNVGVAKVMVYVDGQVIGTAATAPFTVAWDSAKVGNGPHSIVANAYDAAGNVGKSAAVRVNVSNADASQRLEVQFTGKAPLYGTMNHYYVDVKAAGQVQAEIDLHGAANLTLVALDATGRQIASGKGSLSFEARAAGTYIVVVLSYGGWADYALKVTYPPVAGTAVQARSGSLSAAGARYQVYPLTLSGGGSVNAAVTATDRRADLDLYLVDSAGRIVALATSPNLNPETISTTLPAGTYQIYVVADSGKTDYQLTVIQPK